MPLELPDRRDPNYAAKMAEGFGLDELPDPRLKYDDMPPIPDYSKKAEEIGALVNFKKAVSIVDAIATMAFSRYLPLGVAIDQSMNSRDFKYGYSFMAHCSSWGPIPVNPKISAATGIGLENNFENRSIWLAQTILWEYRHFGARGMSPPLVFLARGPGGEGSPGSRQGVIFQLDRTPPDGQTQADIMASLGILLDHGTLCENLVMPIGTTEPEEDDAGMSLT